MVSTLRMGADETKNLLLGEHIEFIIVESYIFNQGPKRTGFRKFEAVIQGLAEPNCVSFILTEQRSDSRLFKWIAGVKSDIASAERLFEYTEKTYCIRNIVALSPASELDLKVISVLRVISGIAHHRLY